MARSFNGTSDKITSAAQQWPQTAFSYTAWIKPTTVTSTMAIATCYDSNVANHAYLQIFNTNPGVLFCRLQQTKDVIYIQRTSNSNAMVASVWQHIAMVWTGGTTDAAIKSYVNGVEVDAVSGGAGTFTAPYSGSDLALNVGWQNSASPNIFSGSMDNSAIYNIALTAGEVLALANGARPKDVRSNSRVIDYPLDGLQSPEPDLSGNKNNGTLTGTALASGSPVMQFTPRWPQFNFPFAAPPFSPAWALNRNRVIEGVAT